VEMKGFAFTLDALLAMIIALAILTAIYTMMPKAQRDYFLESYETKIANDILIVLNKNGTLETHDQTFIRNALAELLPDGYGGRLNVYVYECSNPTCDSFVISNQIVPYAITIDKSTPEKDPVLAKRSFLTFDKNRIKYYSIAELRVWLA